MNEIVICGVRSGKYPLEIAQEHPEARLTVQAYDAYQARKIREDIAAYPDVVTRIEVLTIPYLPEGRTWEAGYFFTDAKLMSAELQLDCLQDLFAHVPSGRVTGVDTPMRKKVQSRVRDFSATWEASVPGGAPMSFESLPGCFCHRRVDVGGLALAETAARLCTGAEAIDALPEKIRILDMGCGAGNVGMLVGDALRRAGRQVHLILVDSHTRAIEAARRNAARHSFEAEVVLSDTGYEGACDLFLGNPPYYGDWRIAELFVETAARTLCPGGKVFMVAKNGEGLANVMRRFFPQVTLSARRTYTIVAATA